MSRKNKFTLIILSIFLIFIAAAVAVVLVLKKDKNEIPQTLFAEGMKLLTEGKHQQALKFLVKAHEELPDNRQIIWELAKLHSSLKNSSQAQEYAILAWNKGKKDRDNLFLLLDNSGLTDLDIKIEYTRKLCEEINDKSLKLEIMGDISLAEEDTSTALDFYKKAITDSPTPELYYKKATAFIRMKDKNGAIKFLMEGDSLGHLDEKAYLLLLSLKYSVSDTDDIDSIFKSVKEKGLEGCDFLCRKAFILMLKNKPEDALTVLRECLKIENITPVQVRKARMMAVYIKLSTGDENLEEFEEVSDKDSPEAEGEKLYLSFVQDFYKDNRQLDEISDQIEKCKRLIPDSFILKMIRAQVESSKGNYDEALKFYETEADPLHKAWSQFTINHAATLQKAGKYRQSIEVLTAFHAVNNYGTLESLVLIRNLHSLLKNFKEAEKVQNALQTKFPDSRQIEIEGAYLAEKAKNMDKALKIFSKIAEECQGKYRFEANKGILKTLLNKNRNKQAFEMASSLVKEDFGYYLYKGYAAVAMGDVKTAESEFRTYIEKDYSPESMHALAFFLLRQKRLKEAGELFEKALKDFKKGWAWTGLASIEVSRRNYQKAGRLLEKALEDESEFLNASILQAQMGILKRQYKPSLAKLDLIETFHPERPLVYELKAHCHKALGDFYEAIANIKKSIKKEPLVSRYELLIECYFQLGKYSTVKSMSLQLIENGHVKTGAALFVDAALVLKEYDEATTIINKSKQALAVEDYILFKNRLTHSSKGTAAALKELEPHLKHRAAAVKWVELKVAKDGNFEKDNKSLDLHLEDWLNLAAQSLRRGNFHSAATCYDYALKLKEDPFILNNYAWCLFKTGEYSQAEKVILKSYKLNSGDERIIDTYSKVLIAAGKYDECIKLVSPIIKSGSVNPALLLSLANSFEKSGSLRESVHFYKKLLIEMVGLKWDLEISREYVESVIEKYN